MPVAQGCECGVRRCHQPDGHASAPGVAWGGSPPGGGPGRRRRPDGPGPGMGPFEPGDYATVMPAGYSSRPTASAGPQRHARPPATGVADLRPDPRRARRRRRERRSPAGGTPFQASDFAQTSQLHSQAVLDPDMALKYTWRLAEGSLRRGSQLVGLWLQADLALSRLCALVLLEILVEHVRVNGCLRGRGGLLGASPPSARKQHNPSAGIPTCARGMACVPPVWPQPARLETSHWLDACAQTWATRVIRRGN